MSIDYIIRKRSGKRYRVCKGKHATVVEIKFDNRIIGWQVGDKFFERQPGNHAYTNALREARIHI